MTENKTTENMGIVVHGEAVASVSLIDTLKNTESEFFSTIPYTGERADAIKVYNAVNGDGEQLSDHLGEILEIENIVAHPIMMEGDDGNVTKVLRTVLVGADGTSYASVSEGVVSSIQKITGIVGSAPWTPALKVVPKEVKTRKGFKVLTLSLV